MPGDEGDVEVARLADRLPVVHALAHGEQPRMLLHPARQGVQVAGARVAGECGPPGQRLARRADRRVHIGGACLYDPREPLGRRRVDDVEELAVRPFDPAPAEVDPECGVVAGEPIEGRLVTLGRGAVLHRLEDLGHA